MSENLKTCPACESLYGYTVDNIIYTCPECAHEWAPIKKEEEMGEEASNVKDMHGNVLDDGDTIIVMKDLKVKGAPGPLKAGTKVKNIRLTQEGDHNIDCKIPGFGAMALKSEFVKKA